SDVRPGAIAASPSPEVVMVPVRVGSIVVCACAFLALAACGDDKKASAARTTSPAEVTVRIGIVAPLTGPQSHIGKDLENAVRLAAEDANASKVTIAGKPVKVEVQAEDDQADPKMPPVVAQKLADAKASAVVGHFNSGTTIPASKIY